MKEGNKNSLRSIYLSVLAATGATVVLFAVSFSMLPIANASSLLAVSCGGNSGPGADTITWTANVSGGTPPYEYFWLGDQVGGSMGSSVTTAYPANGTYEATILVTDAAFAGAAATCSGNVAGIGTSTSTTASAGLEITTTIDNANPQPGSAVNYTLTVSALGPATSTDVTANDLIPDGIMFVGATPSMGAYSSSTGTWTIGDMGPGATVTLGIAGTVDTSTSVGQVISNTATANESSVVTNPDEAQASSTATLTVAAATGGGQASSTTPNAGLAITETVDNTAPPAGSTVHYALTVSALGPATSTDVSVNDLLPSGLTFVTSTPSTGTYESDTGVWTIGDMASGSVASLGIAASIDPTIAGATITNSANADEGASVTNPDEGEASSSVSIVIGNVITTPTSTGTSTLPSAGLEIAESLDQTAPQPGSTVDYMLTVSALGPATSMDVSVNDLLPSGLTLMNASTSSGSYASSTGVWTIGDMASGTMATLDLSALVNNLDAPGQLITNTALATESSTVMNPLEAQASSTATLTVAALPVPPTSTVRVAKILSIGPLGGFLARGMFVTSIASDSFTAQIWGVAYTVEWPDDRFPDFYLRDDASARTYPSEGLIDQLQAGDVVNVAGLVNPENPLLVNANIVRDDSIASPRAIDLPSVSGMIQNGPDQQVVAASEQGLGSEHAAALYEALNAPPENLAAVLRSPIGLGE